MGSRERQTVTLFIAKAVSDCAAVNAGWWSDLHLFFTAGCVEKRERAAGASTSRSEVRRAPPLKNYVAFAIIGVHRAQSALPVPFSDLDDRFDAEDW